MWKIGTPPSTLDAWKQMLIALMVDVIVLIILVSILSWQTIMAYRLVSQNFFIDFFLQNRKLIDFLIFFKKQHAFQPLLQRLLEIRRRIKASFLNLNKFLRRFCVVYASFWRSPKKR